MATDEGSEEDDFYERVLSVSRTRFVSDMDPVALLDAFLQTEFIDYDQYRDISELRLTSEKNKQIVEVVRRKGKWGYSCFKKCLKDSNQRHLVDVLELNETKIEKRTKPKKMFPKDERVSDEDLVSISDAIGKNWELLAPILGLSNTEVDHLEMNYQTAQLRIYKMLLTWKRRTGEDATKANLISKILSIPSVNLNMAVINKYKRHVSGPVLPATYPRVMQQDQISLQQPVEHQISSSSETDRNAYQQMSSNVHDGVTLVNERTNELIHIDQVDVNIIPPTEASFEVSEASCYSITAGNTEKKENKPIQAVGGFEEKPNDAITTLTISIRADPKAKMYNNRSENIYPRLSRNIKAEPSEESNDAISSSDRENRKLLKETFRPHKDKPKRKCTHEGRLMTYREKVFTVIKTYCNTDEPKKGGFGSVYLSERKIPGLEIKIALKEIKCTDEIQQIENSAINEKLASRTMHFAIVPLLFMGCDKDRTTFWFMSPCLVKGDLSTLIERDTQRLEGKLTTAIELSRQRRVRILYHISAAIHFLHTEIEKFRGAVIHLDVKSENIVLDQYYNARLTDFGVAREIAGGKTSVETSPTSIPLTRGYFRPPTFEKLEKYFDYYNIGVVIRELLTGKPPCPRHTNDSNEEYLKDLDQDVVKYYILDKIWKNVWTEKLCNEAEILLEISERCINSATRSGMKSAEKMTSMYILKEMQGIVKDTWERSSTIGDNSERESAKEDKSECMQANEDNSRRSPVREENSVDDNCDLCMVNPKVEKGLLSHASNCRWPLNVCVSCMRNSYLNPLHCHSCFKEIDPIIGTGWGAVLVAGRYDDDLTFSKSCAKDVADIEQMIVSKCPLVIGIRKMFVRTIVFNDSKSSQQSDDATSQIQIAFNELKEVGVRTIFIYYSGHYVKDEGFFLRKLENRDVASGGRQYTSEHLSVRELKNMLKLFGDNSDHTTVRKDKAVILILDCCGSPMLEFGEDLCLKIVQLNACRPNQVALQEPEGTGSLFKKIFIQGLTMKARGDNCIFQKDQEPCHICPIKGDDFITIGRLTSYISRHVKVYHEFQDTEPTLYVHNATEDVKIGYLVDTSADLIFTFILDGVQKNCTIPCHFFNEIDQLKRIVFKEFMEKMEVNKEKGKKLDLNAADYHDILRFITKAGPKDKHKLKLTSLEQVLSAWNGKRELFAEIRDISLIKEGLVGVFRDPEKKQIFSLLDDWKYRMEEKENCIVYKIDVRAFLDLRIKDLHQLNVGVLTLKPYEKQCSELHIIIPSMTDDNGVRHRRDDFVCLKIEKKATTQQQL